MLSTSTKGMDNMVGCGCAILLVVTNVLFGAWSINYLLQAFIAKTLPLWGAALIGLCVGQFSVPVALIVWVLHFLH